jgi:hypothetical protein
VEERLYIMKKAKNEKRVINIPKGQFDEIKDYCDRNSLDMVKWIVKNSLEKTTKKIPEGMLTVKELEIIRKTATFSCPDNWLEMVLKEIGSRLVDSVSANSNQREINWGPVIDVVNTYGRWVQLILTEEQVKTVARELKSRGFNLSVNPDGYTVPHKYKIVW